MLTGIAIHTMFVLDQEEALDFYIGQLGFEPVEDTDLGFMRWLTVSLPGVPERRVLLEVPGPPSHSDETAAQVRDLLTKGALGGLFLTTDDCHGTYKRLKDAGVEFTEEPTEQPYGIDCALRDPFGNHIRISQPTG